MSTKTTAKGTKKEAKKPVGAAKTADEAIKVFHEEPSKRDEMRMQVMVESLWHIYGKEQADEFVDKSSYFMGKVKELFAFSQYDPKDLEQLCAMMPEDTREALEKSKERMAQYMKSASVPPETLVQWRKLMIGWKARLGELIGKYKPMTLAYELGYYTLRGSAFVALTHVGRSLERNIKEGTTVKDREQQSQIMTLGIAKERVYYDFVVEVLMQNQRALADMIDNMNQELIELRHQRRTEEVQPQ